MENWQLALVAVVALLGAVGGGLLGFAKKLKADPNTKFSIGDFIQTVFTGVIAAGVWFLTARETGFGAAVLITGFFVGAGIDYTVKKTILP